MAIIACPSCGKSITDRMKKCPHCGTALLTEKESPPLTKEEIKTAAKDNLIGVLVAFILQFFVHNLWGRIFGISIASAFGYAALSAFSHANSMFSVIIFMLLIIEAVWLCILPRIFKGKDAYQFTICLISVIVFGLFGYIVQRFGTLHTDIPPDVIDYGLSLDIGLGFAFPVLFGGLYLASYKRTVKKYLFLQAGLSVIFFVLSIVLGYLMVYSFGMGLNGISIANLVSAIVVLALAMLTNKEFQRLITPKI